MREGGGGRKGEREREIEGKKRERERGGGHNKHLDTIHACQTYKPTHPQNVHLIE